MPEPTVSFFPAHDGVRLAHREVGRAEDRPLILLPGVLGGGEMWLRHGQAEAFAARGYRVILPDYRGQGLSDKPREASAYPADILTDDALALVDHLALKDGAYDLGGYSLGARIVVRMLVRGAVPRRAVVAGQGMKQVLGLGGGVGQMLRRIIGATEPFEPGSPDAQTAAWLAAGGDDPVALLHTLDSLAATPAEDLARVRVPTLVAMGAEDERAESVDALVEALPNATEATMPGDHGHAPSTPEFVALVLEFLTRDA